MTSGDDSLFITIGGRDVGLADVLRKVDAEMRASADNAVRLGQQYARLAQAQGQPSAASEILAGTLQRAGAASERSIIGIETQAARLANSSTLMQQFGQSAASSLVNIAGPAALATTAISGLVAVGESFGDAFEFKAKLDATTASVKSQLEGFRDVGATYAEAAQFGRQFNFTQEETNSILQSSVGSLRTSTASVTQLETALLRLQSKDVSKPISEAARALAELESGDVTSIKELFRVSAKDALAMRDAIAAGGDSVQVLTAYLDRTQTGMDALKLRAEGVQGAFNELKVAQEDLALAQAQFAQGPGLALLQGQIQVTTGVTRVLSGDFEAARQSIAQAANEGSFGFQLFNTILGGSLSSIATYQNRANEAAAASANAAVQQQAEAAALAAFDAEMQRSGDTTQAEIAYQQVLATAIAQAAAATQQATAATAQATDIEQLRADRSAAAAAATQASAQALVDETTKKLNSAQAAQQLAQFQATLAGLGGAVAGGMQTAGSAAAALASQYNIAYAEALKLISAQAQLAGASTAAARAQARATDFSERHGGIGGGGGLTPAQQARAAAEQRLNTQIADAKAASDAAAAQNEQTLAVGTHAQKLALLQQEYDTAVRQQGAQSKAAIDAQTKLFQEQQSKGRGGGGVRLSDQQKLENSLLADQGSFNDKYEDAEIQHAIALKKIQDDYAKQILDAQRDFNQEQLDSRAGFYDQLGQIESGKIQQAASAQYEAAAIEAGKIAQEKGADVAEKYMQAQEQIISARAKRLAAIEQAEKDKDKGKAEYLRGVDAEYKKAEDAKLARIKEGEGSLAETRDKQIADEGAKYEEAQGKIAESADRAAERKIAAAERAGKKIDEEGLKVDGLAAKYDRLGVAGSRAGVTPAAGAPASPGVASTPAASPAAASAAALASSDVQSLLAKLEDIRAAVDATATAIVRAEKGGADQVAGAIRNLSGAVR